jgi:hypothetical protein
MIGATLCAIALLVGEVAPLERRALQFQGSGGYALPALDTGSSIRNGNRDDTPGMESFVFSDRLIGNTKYQINGRNDPSP